MPRSKSAGAGPYSAAKVLVQDHAIRTVCRGMGHTLDFVGARVAFRSSSSDAMTTSSSAELSSSSSALESTAAAALRPRPLPFPGAALALLSPPLRLAAFLPALAAFMAVSSSAAPVSWQAA